MTNITDRRIDCPMRHENGNCLPCGGFCTANNDIICEAMHNAYHIGLCNGLKLVKNKLVENEREDISIKPDFCGIPCGFMRQIIQDQWSQIENLKKRIEELEDREAALEANDY